jgi:hypothetical protein
MPTTVSAVRDCAGAPDPGPPCPFAVESGAPVPLCPRHLAVAADWTAVTDGVEDLLPTPCPACGARHGVRHPSGWQCAVCEWRLGSVPDGELPPPRVDVVYYIRFDDRVKIGTSANPRQRLARLWHQELLAFERGGRSLERARHEQFARWRWPRTEWFSASDDLLDHVAVVAAGQPDPWAVHARWVSEALALRG